MALEHLGLQVFGQFPKRRNAMNIYMGLNILLPWCTWAPSEIFFDYGSKSVTHNALISSNALLDVFIQELLIFLRVITNKSKSYLAISIDISEEHLHAFYGLEYPLMQKLPAKVKNDLTSIKFKL